MAWAFSGEQTAFTTSVQNRLRTDRAFVPSIWPLEVANSLLVGVRRGRVTQTEVSAFVVLLHTLPIVVDPVDMSRDLGPTLSFAQNLNLSAYDAAYLELALRTGYPIATQDQRMSAAASAAGIPLVT
jgi:predicted nucleic acid-binding protein